jgi:predicted phosphohydrolase
MHVYNTDHPQLPNTLRFVVLSDTHTQTDKLTVPPGDVLLHCGDLCAKGGSLKQVQEFNEFLQMQPHPVKVVIAGNHDFCFDHESFTYLKVTRGLKPSYQPIDPRRALSAAFYLQDEGTVVGGYSLWGSPWVPRFSRTAFSIPAESQKMLSKRQEIPLGTEILMTHSPPQGTLDFSRKHDHGGCRLLAERVAQVRPLVHVFGHIHEGYGSVRTRRTLFINAANCTKDYKGINRPFVFDLPCKTP